jgi:hypothetical protein
MPNHSSNGMILLGRGRVTNNRRDQQDTHALYWDHLKKAEPGEVCPRTMATYSQERRGYILPILNRNYLIVPGEQKIFCLRGEICEEEKLRDFFYLMVLLYLLEAKESNPSHSWISEKELRGGTIFFRGPHALQVEELKTAFGKNPEAFGRAGSQLGGVALLFGDKAFALTVFPKVPLAYVLWKEDDEFPARVTVMFDSTIQNHFSLDGIWCIVAEVSRRLLDTLKP